MRQRICDAAMKIFLEEGFAKATMRRIASEIEYAPGAIYSYFDDKQAVLTELQTTGFARLRALLTAVPANRDPFDHLRALGRAYLRFAFDNPEYYDLMFIMDMGSPAAEHDAPRPGLDTYDLLRQQVKRCQDAGSMPRYDLEAAALALWSMVHGIAALVVKQRLGMIPEKVRPMLVDAAYEFGLEGMRLRRPAVRRRAK